MNFAASCYPERLNYVDDVLEFSVKCITDSGGLEGLESDPVAVDNATQLLSLPLESISLKILELKHYATLLNLLPNLNRKKVAVAISLTASKSTTNIETVVNHNNHTTIESPSSLKSKTGTMLGVETTNNFVEGLTLLVRGDRYPETFGEEGLNGANICVGIGTTTEGNMQDWFSSRSIDFTSVPVADAAEATQKFRDGECDAFTGDMSAMVAKKWQLDNDDTWTDAPAEGIWIAQELMSKEPLGAATRDYDSDFKDVVTWVWYGMVTAEENGVTSGNYAQMATDACATVDGGGTADPGVCRLLTENLGLGTATNPLAGTWMQAVLQAAGNYGEAYDDAFCAGDYDGVSGSDAMNDCLISRAGTLNALVSEGGIQYAPAMR